jgi:hypothetical protein
MRYEVDSVSIPVLTTKSFNHLKTIVKQIATKGCLFEKLFLYLDIGS